MTTTRTFARCIALAIATVGAVFALAGSAHAATFCVGEPACPAGGVAEKSLEAAIDAANVKSDHDTVRLGPGTFDAGYSSDWPLDIVGRGEGKTTVVTKGTFSYGVFLSDGQSTVSDLTVKLTDNRETGVLLQNGADLKRVEVVMADPKLTCDNGVQTEQPGSSMDQLKIGFGDDNCGAGIVDIGGGTITDSDVTAGEGIIPSSDAKTIVRRTVVRASIGLRVFGGIMDAANVLLMPHPHPASSYFQGIEVTNGNANEPASLTAADVTIVGKGSGIGVGVDYNTGPSTGLSTASLTGVLIRDVSTSLDRQGKSASETANLTIDHSSYAANSVHDGAGFGTLVQGPGNITNDPDPKFVNAAAGDYRLRYDSPLLDKGPASIPSVVSDNPDLLGRSRVRDSDGNGSAIRDIGAYEYQRLAPVAAFSATGGTFDASRTSDPDSDPFKLEWAFGDGGGASTVKASHIFTAPGSYLTKLTATDITGLSSTATKTTVVPAAPANPAAPVLTKFSRKGKTFRFKLNQPATVRLVIKRKGHKARTLTFTAHAGKNKHHVRHLHPGRYKVTAVATNRTGQHSKPRSLKFKLGTRH